MRDRDGLNRLWVMKRSYVAVVKRWFQPAFSSDKEKTHVFRQRLVFARSWQSKQIENITDCAVLDLAQMCIAAKGEKIYSTLSGELMSLGHAELALGDTGSVMVLRHLKPFDWKRWASIDCVGERRRRDTVLNARDRQVGPPGWWCALATAKRRYVPLSQIIIQVKPEG